MSIAAVFVFYFCIAVMSHAHYCHNSKFIIRNMTRLDLVIASSGPAHAGDKAYEIFANHPNDENQHKFKESRHTLLRSKRKAK